MPGKQESWAVRMSMLVVVWFVIVGPLLVRASAQGSASPGAAGASIQLQPYTASDQSVSAGVPAGWKVTKGANGVIQMSGPQGEMISLGNGVFVKNGAFQAGQKANGIISMTMPNQATLGQKFAMIWQQAAAGDPSERVNIMSSTPIPLGQYAQCATFLGSQTNAKGSSNFESRFCSLPMDSNGIFKLFWLVAIIPSALAAQERSTAEAVLSSYKPSAATLKLILQPATPPMPPPSAVGIAAGGMSSAAYATRMADETSTCMDEAVIREEPEWKLPAYCR